MSEAMWCECVGSVQDGLACVVCGRPTPFNPADARAVGEDELADALDRMEANPSPETTMAAVRALRDSVVRQKARDAEGEDWRAEPR
jgi:hypothetical protein